MISFCNHDKSIENIMGCVRYVTAARSHCVEAHFQDLVEIRSQVLLPLARFETAKVRAAFLDGVDHVPH